MRNFGPKPNSPENREQQSSDKTRVDKLFEDMPGEQDAKDQFKKEFPEKFEQLNQLVDPNLSAEEFMLGVQEFNDNPGGPVKGGYRSMHMTIKSGREITVNYFQNGRVRVKVRRVRGESPHEQAVNLDVGLENKGNIIDSQEGLTVSQLAKKYNLTEGSQAAFRKEEIKPGEESPVEVGTVFSGKLKNDVRRGDSIKFQDKDAVISSVQDMYEREGKVFIETQTSRYVLGSVE